MALGTSQQQRGRLEVRGLQHWSCPRSHFGLSPGRCKDYFQAPALAVSYTYAATASISSSSKTPSQAGMAPLPFCTCGRPCAQK
jgi:hypothetical protein